MGRRRRRLWSRAVTLALVAASTLLFPSSALASDNATQLHWRLERLDYRILSTVPAEWHDIIRAAAAGWNDPSPQDHGGTRVPTAQTIVENPNSWNHWRREAPPAGWCSSDFLGCTTWELESDNHLWFVTMYFNPNITFHTLTIWCNVPFNYPDVHETAAHEFGHAAGWLNESTQNPDVMAAGLYQGCFRVPTQHDIDGMNYIYDVLSRHPGHSGPAPDRAHWKLNEDVGTKAYDKSGNQSHGTLYNGPLWVPGKAGRALSFDGVDDVVDVGSAASLDDIPVMTISAWIKPNS